MFNLELHKLFGLATGIGSLPHGKPAAALELIYKYCPRIPHWPQLPRRSPDEGFAAQYLAPLINRGIVALNPGGTPYFCEEEKDWEDRCLQFYELLVSASEGRSLEKFAFPENSAAGFYALADNPNCLPGDAICLKGQLSGPVTVGFQVNDPAGSPSFYNQSLRELLVKTLAFQARWQAERLKATGLPAVIFIDDPGIYNYGSSVAVGLGRTEIQAALGEIIDQIHDQGCLAGAHCCAGAEWSLLLELPLDLVSFDAYGYFPSMQVYTDALGHFLERGGALAWGIVPTTDKVWDEDASSLHRLLEEKMQALCRQGVDENRIHRQMIITPSCGAGTLTVETAERIYRLTAELADLLGSSPGK